MSALKGSKTVKGRATKTTTKGKAATGSAYDVELTTTIPAKVREGLTTDDIMQLKKDAEYFARLLELKETPTPFWALFGSIFSKLIIEDSSLSLTDPVVKLLQIRTTLGLSQNEMLRHLGLANELFRSSISKYEIGMREPPLPVLLRYSQAARVCVDVLIDDAADLPKKMPSAPRHKNYGRAVLKPTKRASKVRS